MEEIGEEASASENSTIPVEVATNLATVRPNEDDDESEKETGEHLIIS